MIERIYYRVKLNTDQIIYVDILEAKLNENIIKDPSKTYLIWGYSQFPADSSNAEFKAPAGCTIDWGDGEVQTFDTDSTEVTTHTYSDGISYHLISLSNVNIIKNSSFKGCFWLKGAYISNEVTNIEDNAFNGCKLMTTVSIGANVEYIGNRAFYGCSDLTNVIIPDSVTSIGDYAFNYCNRLKTIKVLSTTPPTLGSEVFYAIEKIIVPKSAINTYKSAAGWSTYADKIVYEVDSSDLSSGGGVTSVTTSGTGNAVTAASISGSTLTLTKGSTFLTSHQSLANCAKLSGNNTFTGNNIFTGDFSRKTRDSSGVIYYKESISDQGFTVGVGSTEAASNTQAIYGYGSIKVTAGAAGTGTLDLPVKTGTLAITDDIDVTAAGNNTFTGTNTFNNGGFRVVSSYGIAALNIDPLGPSGTSHLGTTTITSAIDLHCSIELRAGSMSISSKGANNAGHIDISTGSNGVDFNIAGVTSALKVLSDGIKVNSKTKYCGGKIENIVSGTTYSLTLPSKSGTLALTNDIPIKTATLSGTTLSITLS